MKYNSILLCLLLVMAANSFTIAKAQAVNVNDSLALVDLYNSTNGPNWNDHTNWLTTMPVSTWYGVTVTGDSVTQLYLTLNNVSGVLPASIGNLAALQNLYLDYNQLSGSIPAEIGNLVNLQTLYLDVNHQLSGSIPAEIGNLVNLQKLYLEVNQLTGNIPASIGNLIHLQDLQLDDNQLSGVIPASIGNLVNLQTLFLDDNQLSGSIPASIGDLVNLQTLYLFSNQLSGAIPAALGRLKHVAYLYLDNNQLSGAIPASFGNLSHIQALTLNNNGLTGSIPVSFRNLPQSYFIDVSYNQLSQDMSVQYTTDQNPDISGYINNNLFNFDGLQFVAQTYPAIHYAQQNTILAIHQHGSALSVYAGGSIKKNTYTWHKTGATGSIIIKYDSTFMPAESGRYSVTVTNSIATKTKLHSDTIDYVMPAAKQSSNILMAKAAPFAVIQHLQVFPNPATNIIHIQTNGTATITLTNTAGKTLLTKTIDNTADINVSAFANGAYYIQNKTTGEVRKIVVTH